MIKKFFIPVIFALLIYAFWISPNFKDIAAGIAILLFGMMSLEAGFSSLTEGPLEKLLSKATNKFYKSFSLGLFSTAILQSSSLISVITISFISAELITLVQGVGIIFGSNIGTTATAWLVATLGLKVKISALALPMLVFGVIMILQKSKTVKGIGNVLLGLGFLFLGIHYMKEGFDAYKEAINLAEYAMVGIPGIIVFTGLGLAATVILQSSSATMAVILTALAVGQITYFNALALSVGANIGTTITAILGAIASNAAGKRLAGAHLIFNLVTGMIALLFIYQMADAVNYIANFFHLDPENYTMKLAIFHTMFNLLGVLVMIPFVNKLVKFLEWFIKPEKDNIVKSKYLSDAALAYPQSAAAALMKETKHLFENIFEIIAHGLGLHRKQIISGQLNENIKLKPVPTVDINESYYRSVKNIFGDIIKFATQAQELHPSNSLFSSVTKVKQADRYFVNVVKDIKELQPNMLKFTNSDDPIMKKEYEKLRIRIAKVVRQVIKSQSFDVLPDQSVEQMAESARKHIEKRKAKLNKYMKRIKDFDVLYNGTLDSLIRKHEISPEMASSLINDNATTASICKHLIYAAELLYLNTDNLLAGVNVDIDYDMLYQD